MSTEKKYGLIIPARKKALAGVGKITKPSVFADSSSDEEDSGRKKGFKSSLWQENKKKAKQIQSHEAVVKALAEDPSVFEYDNIYDDLQEKKKKKDPRLQKKDTKPKYIHDLMKTAERRKIEQDIIYERKVQRDMEKEGKEYKDKDTFLTSAYRKKLEERKKMEEELLQEEKREAANDVTKQKDLSMFHRHILHRLDHGTVGEEERKTEKSTTSDKRRASKDGKSSIGRERERRKGRSESDEDHINQQGESRSYRGEESEHSRHRSEGSVSAGEENIKQDIVDKEADSETMEEEQTSKERLESEHEGEGGEEEMPREDDREMSAEVTPKLPSELTQEDKEERRKVAAAKRTDSQAQLSAKERYLARKRARTTAALVVKDD